MKKGKKAPAKKGKKAPAKKEADIVVVPVKRGRGQPTIFNDKLAATICERLASGESLRAICRDPKMPAISTVLGWLFDHRSEQFIKDYTRAREINTDVVFEETMEMADKSGEVIVGDDRSDGARVSAAKLAVDTRKWFLSRMQPKKYGEKLDVTSAGKELKQPRPVAITYGIPTKPKAS